MPINKNNNQRFKILNELLRSKKWYTIAEMAQIVNEQLETDDKKPVTERTIRNDLKTMQSDYRVEIDSFAGKFRYTDPDDSIDRFSLNSEEKDVMEMARQAFVIFRGTPFYPKFDEIFRRITGSSVMRNIEQGVSASLIQVGEQGNDTGVRWLHIIYQAIVQKTCLKISYKPYGQEVKIRTVSPYLLKEYRNKWYMVAHAKEIIREEKTNLFKLFRIDAIEKAQETYVENQGFNAAHYFKHSLGIFHSHALQPQLIRLMFNIEIAPLILESPIHPSMKVIRNDSQGLEVTLYVYETVELKNLILSFGSQCRVMSPEHLKDQIRSELESALNQY